MQRTLFASSPSRERSSNRAEVSPEKEVVLASRGSSFTAESTFVVPGTILSCASDGERVWTIEAGAWVRTRDCRSGSVISQASLSGSDPACICRSGEQLWIGCTSGIISVLQAETLRHIADCSVHSGAVTALVSCPTGVLSVGTDGRIARWSSKFVCAACTVLSSHPINCCSYATGHAFCNGEPGVVLRVDAEQLSVVGTYVDDATAILSISFCQGRVWTGNDEGVVSCFDVSTGQRLSATKTHSGSVHALTVVGSAVLSASTDGSAVLWSSPGSHERLPMSFAQSRQNDFVFSAGVVAQAQTLRLWTCGTDGAVRAWLTQTSVPEECTNVLSEPISMLMEDETQNRQNLMYNWWTASSQLLSWSHTFVMSHCSSVEERHRRVSSQYEVFIAESEAEAVALRRALSDGTSHSENALGEVARLRESLARSEEHQRQLRTDAEQLTRALDESRAATAARDAECERLGDRVHSLAAERDALTNDLQLRKERHDRLEDLCLQQKQELERMKQTCKHREAEIAKLKGDINALHSSDDASKRDARDMKEKVERLKATTAELQARIVFLEERAAVADSNRALAEDRNEALSVKLAENADEIATLLELRADSRTQMEDCQQALAARSTELDDMRALVSQLESAQSDALNLARSENAMADHHRSIASEATSALNATKQQVYETGLSLRELQDKEQDREETICNQADKIARLEEQLAITHAAADEARKAAAQEIAVLREKSASLPEMVAESGRRGTRINELEVALSNADVERVAATRALASTERNLQDAIVATKRLQEALLQSEADARASHDQLEALRQAAKVRESDLEESREADRDELASLRREIQRLLPFEETSSTLEERCSSLHTRLEESSTSLRAEQQRARDLERQTRELNADLDAMRRSRNVSVKKASDADAEADKRLHDADQKMRDMTTLLKESEVEAFDLRRSLASAQANALEATRLVSRLEAQVDELQRKAERDADSLNRKVEEAKAESRVLNESVATLRASIESKNALLADAKREAEHSRQTQDEHHDASRSVRQLESERDELRRSLRDATEQFESLQTKLKGVTQQLDAVKSERDADAENTSALESRLATALGALEAERKRGESLDKQLELAKQANKDAVSAELNAAERRMEQAKQERDAIQGQLSNMQESFAQLEQAKRAVVLQLEEGSRTIHTLRAALSSSETKHDALESRIAVLESEGAAAARALGDVNACLVESERSRAEVEQRLQFEATSSSAIAQDVEAEVIGLMKCLASERCQFEESSARRELLSAADADLMDLCLTLAAELTAATGRKQHSLTTSQADLSEAVQLVSFLQRELRAAQKLLDEQAGALESRKMLQHQADSEIAALNHRLRLSSDEVVHLRKKLSELESLHDNAEHDCASLRLQCHEEASRRRKLEDRNEELLATVATLKAHRSQDSEVILALQHRHASPSADRLDNPHSPVVHHPSPPRPDL